MTLNEAVFESRADAVAAASAAMPRRKRNRPYALSSGYHAVRAVACPECGATPSVACDKPFDAPHEARIRACRDAGRSADRWIVVAPSNLILRRDGSMFDHVRGVVIR